MLKRHHRFFQSLQVIRDATLVLVSFALAFVGRFSFPEYVPYETVSPFRETIIVGLMFTGVWTMTGWVGGLYFSRRTRGMLVEVFDVFRTTVVAFFLVVTVTYFVREVRYSRIVFVFWAIATCFNVSAARVLSRIVLHRLRARGLNLRHVLVIGVGELAEQVVRLLDHRGGMGLRVAGLISVEGDPALGSGESVAGRPIVGTIENLEEILQERSIDQVIVALPIEQLGVLRRVMERLSLETVDVRLMPDLNEYITLCGSVEEFGGMPVINLQASPLTGWNMVVKRSFDISAAICGFFLIFPLLLVIAAVIKMTSRGPAMYAQERVGMDGRKFLMYKFRTMSVQAEQGGAQMTVPGDPRCTSVGGLLRRLSFDELPQLLNVLRGDMSLVGPRPERPCFIEDFKKEVPRYALRHKMKAGMTGWAQINGLRGNTSIHRRIELDLYYIENWSLMLDLKILLKTVFGGFLSRNAY